MKIYHFSYAILSLSTCAFAQNDLLERQQNIRRRAEGHIKHYNTHLDSSNIEQIGVANNNDKVQQHADLSAKLNEILAKHEQQDLTVNNNNDETEMSVNEEEVTEVSAVNEETETELAVNDEMEAELETELETELSANQDETENEMGAELATALETAVSANDNEMEAGNEADNNDKANLAEYDQTGIASVVQSRSQDDVKEALNTYFNSLQVALGYVDPPSDKDQVKEMMAPFVKEVQWALGVMHPGFDKDLVNDDVVMNQLTSNIAAAKSRKSKSNNDNTRRRNLADSDMCLEKTRDILSMSMRLAYYGLYGDMHSSDEMIQNSGKDIADQLDIEEARERLRTLGPLQKGEEDYRLIAREAFKFAESEVGLDGIINYGMKSWDVNNFWATGFFASEMWASALQISVFDTFPITSQTFTNPDITSTDTVDNEFAKMIDAYNDHCATCPTGWTDNGISKHGLHCTTGFSPTCDGKCLESACSSVKGKWEDVDLEFNPYTCYMSVCPSGWSNLGRKDAGLMCTMHRSHACDESCAEVQCEDVGGSFPLAIDDVADNPYVCFV